MVGWSMISKLESLSIKQSNYVEDYISTIVGILGFIEISCYLYNNKNQLIWAVFYYK